MAGPATPKPRSGAFRALRERLNNIFDAEQFAMIALAALDRERAEGLVRRAGRMKAAAVKKLSRVDLIAHVTAVFLGGDDGAYEVVAELDRSTRAERS